MEDTGIVPDRRFTQSANSGMRLDAGDIFSFFTEESESSVSTLSWKGLYTGIGTWNNLYIGGFAAEYSERDDGEKDIWYTDRKTGYGRKITAGGITAAAKSSFAGIGVSAAATGCRGMENGFFYRVSPYLLISVIRIDLLASGTNDSYISPDGSFPSTEFRRGISMEIKPLSWITLDIGYVSDIKHRRTSDEKYGDYNEELFSDLMVSPGCFMGGCSVKTRNIFTDDSLSNSLDMGFSAGLRQGLSKIVFEKKDSFKNNEIFSRSYRLETGIRKKYIDIYMLGKVKKEEFTEKSIKSRLSLKKGKISVFGEYTIMTTEKNNGDTENFNEYSAGLEVKY